MNNSIEKLSRQRVSEVMARDVITVQADSSMAEAAQLLRDYDVSGAPVVDESGRCIGVISSSDFVDSKSEESTAHGHVAHVATSVDPTGLQRAEVLNRETVRANMSSNVQSIRENLTIVEAGRILCQEHIHRLVVIDAHGRPVGIISSLDLVSTLVHAAE